MTLIDKHSCFLWSKTITSLNSKMSKIKYSSIGFTGQEAAHADISLHLYFI